MPPKRPPPSSPTDPDLMPPPSTTPSVKRRHLNITTPSIPVPPSLFFAIPHPPLSASPDHPPPSNTQFTDFLHAQAAALPPGIHTLYTATLANLEPDNTPDLTSEMRASLTAAVTAFTVHLSPSAGEEGEGEGHRQLDFLRRLAAGEVRGRELVNWADTITAALTSFSATGGTPDPPSAPSTTSTRSPAQAAPTPPEMHNTTVPARSRSHSSAQHTNTGRSAAIRNRTLVRDGHACVVTGLSDALAIDVAHIIPFSVRGEKAVAFWGLLGIFLGAEGVEALRGATLQLAGSASVREVANCMVLDAVVHRYFDGGSVEILPVVGSGAWGGVGREYDPSVVSTYDISIHYPGCAALPLHRCIYSTPAPGTQTGKQLLSTVRLTPGTTVTLTTPDPATMPLPHPLLLQLHAVCGRVKRLRAAAGWPLFPPGDESDGEEMQWGEEEEMQWGEEEDDIGGRSGESVVVGPTMAPPEEGIRGWVQRCSLPVDGGSGVDPAAWAGGSGVERWDKKRKFGDGVEQVGELEEEGPEDVERPRKVAAVMDEMEMREEERRRLVGGRAGRRGLGM